MKSVSLDDIWGLDQTTLDETHLDERAEHRFTNSHALESLCEESAPYSSSRNLLRIERTTNPLVSNKQFVPKDVYSESKGTAHAFESFNVDELEDNGEYIDRLGRTRKMRISRIPQADKDYHVDTSNVHISRLQGLNNKYTTSQYGNKKEVASIVNLPEPSSVLQAKEVKDRAQKAVLKNVYMNKTGVQAFPAFDSGRDNYDGVNFKRVHTKSISTGYRADHKVSNNAIDLHSVGAKSNIAHATTTRVEPSSPFSRTNNSCSSVEMKSTQSAVSKTNTNRSKTDNFDRFPVTSVANVHVVGDYRVKDTLSTRNTLIQRQSNQVTQEPMATCKAHISLNSNMDDKNNLQTSNQVSRESHTDVRADIQLNPLLNNTQHIYRPVPTTTESISKRITSAVPIGTADDMEVENILCQQHEVNASHGLHAHGHVDFRDENVHVPPVFPNRKHEADQVKSTVQLSEKDEKYVNHTSLNNETNGEYSKNRSEYGFVSTAHERAQQDTSTISKHAVVTAKNVHARNMTLQRSEMQSHHLMSANGVAQTDARPDVSKRLTAREGESHDHNNAALFVPIVSGEVRGAFEMPKSNSGMIAVDRLDLHRYSNSRLEERMTPVLNGHDRTAASPRFNSGISQTDQRHTPMVVVSSLRV